MNSNRVSTMVFLCFFLSGIAGLVYEVLWIRQLSLVFGTTSFAVSTVLASFMGGMAIGSWLFGRIADRRRDPLRLYAILEAATGVYCLFIPVLFGLVNRIWVLTSHSMGGDFYSMSLVRFALCFLTLVLPTLFMGATLPVLSRFVVRRLDRIGAGVGRLYGLNTFGAVIGTFSAGYLLIGSIGVWKTTLIAVALNFIVALLAWTLHRSEGGAAPVESAPAEKAETPDRRLSAIRWAILIGIALSGFASLSYEVAWTRLLSLVLGSSVYAFAAMLTTFLLGIALGSTIISRLADRFRNAYSAFAAIQAAIAVGVLLVTPLFDRLPTVFLHLYARMGERFWSFQMVQFLLCFLVMFVPTLLIGATIPLVVKALTGRVNEIGKGVGKVYAFNTFGAIAGSFFSGFVFIPLLGTQKTIAVAAAVNLATAIAVIVLHRRPRLVLRTLLAGGLAVLFAVLVLLGGRWDRYMLNTGFFDSPRYSLHEVGRKGYREYIYSYDIIYFEEGTYANVAVSQEAGNLFLQINGRTEASTTSDMSNQILVSQIPMLIHPDPKEVLVIGLGSGITLGSVVTHPVDYAECVEISPAVVRAAAYFRDWHGDVTKNPRVRMILDDGRNYLLASERAYDVIVSEPSKPWISGVSNLFTRECYQLLREHLKPGGIACQWFHYYSMSPRDFRITLRTFLSVFPYVQVWNADNNVFLLGSDEPIQIDTESIRRRMESVEVRRDLDRIDVKTVYRLLGHYMFGEKEAREYVGKGPLNTDDLPLIEFSAPRHRNSYQHEEILRSMLEAYPRFDNFPLVGQIAQNGDTIDFRLAGFRFRSPVQWQTGVATVVRSVVEEERLEEEVEGPLLAYRMEAKLAGSRGEELGIFAFSRVGFSQDKLRRTLERLAPGLSAMERVEVEGNTAFWAEYEPGERPLAAITWFYPPNKLHYLVQMVGPPDASPGELRRLLVEGVSCSPLAVDEPVDNLRMED
ncbi:MAG: fused MFS/spermidine synthase [Candidatus Eisenbacteria bacterium]|nr:fused MFS/spermidine synthase [Candidatus Eisenbacteria bacterium]